MLKVKLLDNKAVMPQKAHASDAGYDLVATSEKLTMTSGTPMAEYGTSVAVQIPEGYVGLLVPRSSIGNNTTLVLANSCGIIDSGFLGEIKFQFRQIAMAGAKKYKIGDRIGQLVVIKLADLEMTQVSDFEQTDRGTGSFGSSGL